ncbi:hypothetical protein V9T40_007722 [Parthenolecanium corni]|uniref:Exonuclease domain-containing protein n=1 Tax=Parthenolecanium corni TaxID=536013 RepID=A0AAN9TVT9_9HEMI
MSYNIWMPLTAEFADPVFREYLTVLRAPNASRNASARATTNSNSNTNGPAAASNCAGSRQQKSSKARHKRAARVEKSKNATNSAYTKSNSAYYESQPAVAAIAPAIELPDYVLEDWNFIAWAAMYVIPPSYLPLFGFPFLDIIYNHYDTYFFVGGALTMGYDLRGKDSFDIHHELYKLDAEAMKTRLCSRCSQCVSTVPQSVCTYHPGRYNNAMGHTCCYQQKEATGCSMVNYHVWNGLVPGLNGPLEGFVMASQPKEYPSSKHKLLAVDCEMCYTAGGLELTRVTLVDTRMQKIYDQYVLPENEIIDYNTQFSGITKETLQQPGVKRLAEVQQDILEVIDNDTILVGHGLENDLRALKLVHTVVIDTALLYSNCDAFKRRSLKHLAHCFLHRDIQMDANGHDSAEDASVSLQLVGYAMFNKFPNPFLQLGKPRRPYVVHKE